MNGPILKGSADYITNRIHYYNNQHYLLRPGATIGSTLHSPYVFASKQSARPRIHLVTSLKARGNRKFQLVSYSEQEPTKAPIAGDQGKKATKSVLANDDLDREMDEAKRLVSQSLKLIDAKIDSAEGLKQDVKTAQEGAQVAAKNAKEQIRTTAKNVREMNRIVNKVQRSEISFFLQKRAMEL